MITYLQQTRFAIIFAIFFIFSIITSTAIAQVGINTTSPTAMLDVNGGIRIRAMGEDYGSHVVTSDKDGNIQRVKTFLLYDANEVLAENKISVRVESIETINNIDLGLRIPVVIPANKEAKVIINYSVPMGTTTTSNPTSSYIGATLIKDGYEEEGGSRKFSIPHDASGSSSTISKMNTLTNTYVDNFDPTENERTVYYTVYGYIEQQQTGPLFGHEYIFNMWSPSGSYYNWGKASINYQVYIK